MVQSALLFHANPSAKVPGHSSDQRWLVRYARHCKFQTAEHEPTTEAIDLVVQGLRSAFGAPAWRLVCKSPKSAFLPILRSRELSLEDLITYCRRLAERSFVQAPQPILLTYFLRQRRIFHDRPCRVPEDDDYEIMRVANRHHIGRQLQQQPGHQHTDRPNRQSLTVRDIATVVNWAHQTCTQIKPNHQWSALLRRARKHFEQDRIQVASEKHAPWHFFCGAAPWRGHCITPIADPFGLWHQGQRHGNCLYKLRFECTSNQPSRFFSVTKAGHAVATLELAWRAPQSHFTGMDRVWGRWELQDLRLSYNRLPDPSLLDSMHSFATMYNTWSKRVHRQPPGYINALIRRIAAIQDPWRVLQPSADHCDSISDHQSGTVGWPPQWSHQSQRPQTLTRRTYGVQ
jgi:hypothetical protein